MRNSYNNNTVKGLSVRVKDGYNAVEKALKKFRKKVEEDGRLKTVREKQEFVAPSEQRRIDKKRAISRHKKRMRDEQRDQSRKWQ